MTHSAPSSDRRKFDCNFPGCGRNGHALNLCSGHYRQQYEGRPLVPLKVIAKKGQSEWKIAPDGYVVKKARNAEGRPTTEFQHRTVMEKYLGRKLRKSESVHHKNGNRQDNRISNLELWSTSQPAGQRVEDKLEWAKEILELYKNENI